MLTLELEAVEEAIDAMSDAPDLDSHSGNSSV